jgi:hypothetical protein
LWFITQRTYLKRGSIPPFVRRLDQALGDMASSREMRLSSTLALAVSLLATSARADQVYLDSGRVIEGEAKVEGDRIVIALESGKIVLPARSVVKVEQTRPAIEEARAREATLRGNDVEGLLALADFCRERELRAKEHELLQRVLRIAPDHEIARKRLGYVRTKDGWISGAERVRHERERAYTERRAELEKRREEVELEKKRAELTLGEAKLERERAALIEERTKSRDVARDDRPLYPSYYVAPYPYQPPALSPPSGPPPFGINGARSPHDTSFSIPGVRDPRTYFGDALRR